MSELVNRAGVHAAAYKILRINWFFREQHESDQGVDGIIEAVDVSVAMNGHPREDGTGELLAIQLKSGKSRFDEPSDDGWWFRFDAAHSQRWLNVALPAVVVLVDEETQDCFWQELSPATMTSTGVGYKVNVPATHRVEEANEAWRVLASRAAVEAPLRYEESLSRLPPAAVIHVQVLAENASLDAALLALHMAEGRKHPKETVEALVASTPLWLTRNGSVAWLALATFAAAHDLNELAADCFDAAATVDETQPGRWWASAAIQYVYVDRAKAAALTQKAEDAGAEAHLVLILRAVIAQPEGDANPVPVPSALDIESETVRGSGFAQIFLAISAQRSGDVAGALKHASLALATDPSNASLMAHRAEMALWASSTGHADLELRSEGMDLLQAAIAQRREWGGSTRHLSAELARAALSAGQFPLALNTCLPAPDGTADDEVAADSDIRRLALVAASNVGRQELSQRIAAQMSDGEADLLAKMRAGLLEATPDEHATWLQADLSDALAADEPLRAVQVALELSELGIDTSQAMSGLAERGILDSDTLGLLRALALAHTNLDTALPKLRSLARTNKQASAYLVQLLMDAGRLPEALAACETVLAARRDPGAVLARAHLLIRSNDLGAEAAALEAARELDGFVPSRRDLYKFAAREAVQRNEWDVAERHLQEAVNLPGAVPDDLVWMLVTAQLQLGRLDRARYSIDKHLPEVDKVEDAELWIQAHAATSLDVSKAAKALELAEKFNHPEVSTALLGLIVGGTHGVDPEAPEEEDDEDGLNERRARAMTAVPADLHRRAYAALGRLVEEHGEASGAFVLRGDGDELLAQLTDKMRAAQGRDKLVSDLAQQAQHSALPVAVVATAAAKGYATTLVQRSLGMLPAGAVDDTESEGEVAVAASALNSAVVGEASSLLTATGEISDLCANFATLTISAATLRDIHRAQADLRAAASSPGAIYLAPGEDVPTIAVLPPDEYLRRLTRVERLVALATSLPVRNPSARDALPDLAGDARMAAWLDSIELAHDLDVPLWSDDLGLRRVARLAGVRAFGTPALVIALTEQAATEAAAERLDEVIEEAARQNLRLAADWLVDIPLRPGDLFTLAEEENWKGGAATVALSRPSWWHWNQGRFDELAPIFAAVRKECPEAVGHWQLAAMTGAGRAFLDPNTRSRVLCSLALVGWDNNNPHEHVRDGLGRARSVAKVLGLEDPVPEMGAALRSSEPQDAVHATITEVVLAVLAELGTEQTEAERETPDDV